MRAYIAGPMTGKAGWNFPAFDEAATWLRSRGIEPVNPADLDRAVGFDESVTVQPDGFRERALRRDVEALLTVDAVVLLPDWEPSAGANLEVSIAEALGLPVYLYDPIGRLTWKDPVPA